MNINWEESIILYLFFFFLTEQKRTRAKLCLWIYDQNVELIPTVLTIEINRN